jgi:hypothetical protein
MGGDGVGGVILEDISKFELDKLTKSSPNSFRDIFTFACWSDRLPLLSPLIISWNQLLGLSTILDCSTLEMHA